MHGQIICTGKMLNAKDSKIETVCFLRTPNPIGNITKYSIILSGIEIYEVEFTYYKDDDSILIKLYDKQDVIVKRETVKLTSEDSHFLISDFKPNVNSIANSGQYRILFGIDHPNKQYISLYQFQSIGGTQTQFKLRDVPDSVLLLHKRAVNNYEVLFGTRQKYSLAMESLRRDMGLYKDSVINSVMAKEDAKRSKEAIMIADNTLQAAFVKKMDDIFLGYFKNIHTFNDEAIEVSFTFFSNANGRVKIDPIRSLNFKNGYQRRWLRDSFMLNVKPIIEKGLYNTLSETYSNHNLKPDFAKWFENNFAGYSNLGPAERDSFTPDLKLINDELDRYENRTINIPTVFTYSFKYVSSVKTPTWKYTKESDGNDKFVDKSDEENRVEITDKLKQIFKNKYRSLGNGKYNLKISTISINNGAFTGQDIQIINNE